MLFSLHPRCACVAAVACFVSLIVASLAPAQTVTLRLDSPRRVVAPGEDFIIDVHLDNPSQVAIGGYQAAVRFPTADTQLASLPALSPTTGVGENFDSEGPPPVGAGFPQCTNWSDGIGHDVVSALATSLAGMPFDGDSTPLYRFTLNTLTATGPVDFEFNNFQNFCPSWTASIVVDPNGNLIQTGYQGVSLAFSTLPAVTGVICTPEPAFMRVNWDVPMPPAPPYDSFVVYRDGQQISFHTPADSEFLDPTVEPGETYTYAVVGVISGEEAPYTTCEVTVPVVPVQFLQCEQALIPDAALLSWQNFVAYSGIDVFRDGVLDASLPGNAESYVASVMGKSGDVEFTVIAYTPTGLPSPSEMCTYFAVPPVEALTCMYFADDMRTLSWTNPTSYDSVTILRDSSVVATLTNGEDSYTDTDNVSGDVVYAVQASAMSNTSSSVFCTVVAEVFFERGDTNFDGSINLVDATAILNYAFAQGVLTCLDAADFNDDGSVNLVDAVNLLNYSFASGAPPPAPFGALGPDPTADSLPPCLP